MSLRSSTIVSKQKSEAGPFCFALRQLNDGRASQKYSKLKAEISRANGVSPRKSNIVSNFEARLLKLLIEVKINLD